MPSPIKAAAAEELPLPNRRPLKVFGGAEDWEALSKIIIRLQGKWMFQETHKFLLLFVSLFFRKVLFSIPMPTVFLATVFCGKTRIPENHLTRIRTGARSSTRQIRGPFGCIKQPRRRSLTLREMTFFRLLL